MSKPSFLPSSPLSVVFRCLLHVGSVICSPLLKIHMWFYFLCSSLFEIMSCLQQPSTPYPLRYHLSISSAQDGCHLLLRVQREPQESVLPTVALDVLIRIHTSSNPRIFLEYGHFPPLGRPEKWTNPPSIFGFLRLFEVLLGALGHPPPAIVFLCGGEALAIDLGW